MKLFNIIFLLTLLTSNFSFGQNFMTLSGRVNDADTNELLIGVNIIINDGETGTTTNEYGFYSISLKKDIYKVEISYLGYNTELKEVDLNADKTLNFQLSESTEQLEEILITSKTERSDVKSAQMSVNNLSVKTIKKIPVVLGESDIVKSILLLPGITNAGDASSGFNVRGGAVDQNLILLDEATIYNSSHLFGLFSVFNPDAIKDIKLYKGGIPARYGGRVSSVLEIFQKEGNNKELKVNGGVGLVASRLLVEGPIVKEKSSFLIGGRSSYAHLFLPLFDIDNSASFYDLNAKLNYRLNENNNLYLSGYFGRDFFSINDNFQNVYGNATLNLRWNHLYGAKLFSNLSLIYSDFYYGLELGFVGFKWNSGITNLNFKYDFKHYLKDNLQVNYGIHNTYYVFNPGKIEPNSADSGILEDQLVKNYANETALYIGIDQDLTNNLNIQYGLRVSNFIRLGQDEIFVYENNEPVIFDRNTLTYQEADPIDTIYQRRSKPLKTYLNFEPRIAASLSLNDNNSIKASYTRLAQYLHLLSNTSSPTPLDVWTPSGTFIKPQLLDHIALGYFLNFKNDLYSFEIETYYKKLKNRIDYIDGANLIANEAIERVILNGRGRSYGLELILRKNKGDFQGWISYTLSKSEQQTPGRTRILEDGTIYNETGINLGNWYNTPYDKPHDISIFGSYDLNEKWSFSGNFVYQTGRPTNYPVGQLDFQRVTAPVYGLRNQQRLPSYHRIDVSATLTPRKNKYRSWQGQWVFSIYNIYNRQNAISINFRQNEDTGVNEAIRTSIFGIVPAITYNFKF
ncbi:TonB-dependent receptor [Aegicerativicinus sediminis]|uniref:TonB-dependent receptor n=1 Tax=Aegicerativicinus sediminis TaxID=2893202 RepID=UPI003743D4A9